MSFGIMRNSEGYYDPIAGRAIINVMHETERKKTQMESKKIIKRGEIYYIEHANTVMGSEQRAGRPAVVVSNDRLNATSTVVEVVYLTSQAKYDQPTHVTVRSSERESTALCEQIHSVSAERVGDYLGECTAAEMQQIDTALLISLGIELKASAKEEKTAIEPAKQPSGSGLELFAEKVKLQTEVERLSAQLEVYKDLYNGLLSQVMSGKTEV